MKIVIIGSAHPLRGGGISTFNEKLSYELGTTHDVTIYSFSLQYPSFLFPGKDQFTEEPAPLGLKIKSRINSINPINWIKVGNEIKNMQPDLVIVRYWLPFMGPCFGTILRRIRKNRHSKIIAITDNVIPHEKRAGDLLFTKYFLKPVDGFISMSKDVLKDLKTFDNYKPASYVPHPLYDNYGPGLEKHLALQHLKLDPSFRYILFFGFIRKYKGLDILLDAMADKRIKGSNIKLIIAGEYYGDATYYQSLIEKLQLQNQLELFTDFIPNDEIKYYFSAADCVVQPYRTATQSGISQIAYHFEKPMIVTNVGGLPEIVPDGKVGYVTDVDPSAIATAIQKFYEQPLAFFIDNIKQEKKQYEWHHFTSAIISLYKKLLP